VVSVEDDVCRRVERELAGLGILVRVKSVGEEGLIALIRPEDGTEESLFEDKREEIVSVCRTAGFRNAAVQLFWE
jgi:hypothetical protein